MKLCSFSFEWVHLYRTSSSQLFENSSTGYSLLGLNQKLYNRIDIFVPKKKPSTSWWTVIVAGGWENFQLNKLYFPTSNCHGIVRRETHLIWYLFGGGNHSLHPFDSLFEWKINFWITQFREFFETEWTTGQMER